MMKQPGSKKRKDDSIFLRLPKDEKGKLQELANKRGMTLTELLLSVGEKGPIRDYRHEKELFQYIMALTTQMNAIGKEIKALASRIPKDLVQGDKAAESVQEFNQLFTRYLENRDELSLKLENLITR